MASLKNLGISGLALATFFILSVLMFFSPRLRDFGRAKLALPERKILSVAVGQVIPNMANSRIAKVLTRDGLYLEIYGPAENGFEPLIDRIKLPDRRDAFIQFQGRATNLAIQDMNGDRKFEIIAPSYDDSFVPHLNIYHYNSAIGHFEPYEKP